MAKKKYWARRPLGYNGKEYDRGQILSLANLRNDEALVRIGYIKEVERKATLHQCDECGAKFIGIGERTGHFKKRHLGKALNPEQEDAKAESEEKKLQEAAPLYMDKTKASMGVAA